MICENGKGELSGLSFSQLVSMFKYTQLTILATQFDDRDKILVALALGSLEHMSRVDAVGVPAHPVNDGFPDKRRECILQGSHLATHARGDLLLEALAHTEGLPCGVILKEMGEELHPDIPATLEDADHGRIHHPEFLLGTGKVFDAVRGLGKDLTRLLVDYKRGIGARGLGIALHILLFKMYNSPNIGRFVRFEKEYPEKYASYSSR
jgi:hypothetical protein